MLTQGHKIPYFHLPFGRRLIADTSVVISFPGEQSQQSLEFSHSQNKTLDEKDAARDRLACQLGQFDLSKNDGLVGASGSYVYRQIRIGTTALDGFLRQPYIHRLAEDVFDSGIDFLRISYHSLMVSVINIYWSNTLFISRSQEFPCRSVYNNR